MRRPTTAPSAHDEDGSSINLSLVLALRTLTWLFEVGEWVSRLYWPWSVRRCCARWACARTPPATSRSTLNPLLAFPKTAMAPSTRSGKIPSLDLPVSAALMARVRMSGWLIFSFLLLSVRLAASSADGAFLSRTTVWLRRAEETRWSPLPRRRAWTAEFLSRQDGLLQASVYKLRPVLCDDYR